MTRADYLRDTVAQWFTQHELKVGRVPIDQLVRAILGYESEAAAVQREKDALICDNESRRRPEPAHKSVAACCAWRIRTQGKEQAKEKTP